jgi:argininosuccinate lyase
LIGGTEADESAAQAALEKGLSLALTTDVAEYLVVKGMPFRDAHWQVGKLVKYCLETKKHLTALSLEEWQTQIPEAGPDVLDILSMKESVARRKTYGGTAFTQVAAQIAAAKERLLAKTEALEVLHTKLQDCAL